MEYVGAPRDEGCFLCRAAESEAEADDLVLARRDSVFAIINRYPYNTGHVMVAPVRHVGDVEALDDSEHLALMRLIVEVVEAVRNEMSPDGFNIGANLGETAGAGLPGHFHMHVVPRWAGDTNFMPVIGGAKVLPEILEETYRRLRPRFG